MKYGSPYAIKQKLSTPWAFRITDEYLENIENFINARTNNQKISIGLHKICTMKSSLDGYVSYSLSSCFKWTVQYLYSYYIILANEQKWDS